jgi:hypothetical protein
VLIDSSPVTRDRLLEPVTSLIPAVFKMSGTHALHALFDENKVNHTEMTAELPVREGELSKPTEAKLKSSKGEKKQGR